MHLSKFAREHVRVSVPAWISAGIIALGSALGSAVALGASSCATLDPLTENVCGNGVIDNVPALNVFEDCDDPKDLLCSKATEASPCKRKCDTTAGQPKCPSGWGCGVDGICRQPRGEFSQVGANLSSGVFSLQVGDFDGDGRKDLLGTSARGSSAASNLKIHYFKTTGDLDEIRLLPAGLTGPQVVDLNDDAIDDIAFGFSGIGLLSGVRTRDVLPRVYSSAHLDTLGTWLFSLQSLVAGKHLPTQADSDVFTMAPDGTQGPGSGIAIGSVLGSGTAQFKIASVAPIDTPIVTTLYGKPAPCGHVLVPELGGMRIFSPCAVAPTDSKSLVWAKSTQIEVDRIQLPIGTLLAYTVADFNADQKLDVLLLASIGGSDTIPYVYLSDPVLPKLGPATILQDNGGGAGGAPPGTLRPRALSAADFNGDGYADIVTPIGILLAQPPDPLPAPQPSARAIRKYSPRDVQDARARPWSEARVADLNADGRPDVLATTDDPTELQISLTGGPLLQPSFTLFSMPLSAQLIALDIGDFDGDGTADIVVATGSTAGAEQISIAFGNPFGAPSALRAVASYPFVKDLRAFVVEGARQGIALSAYDSTPEGKKRTGYAALLITGDRQAIAPLFLRSSDATQYDSDTWRTTSLISGRLSSADGTPKQLLAVAERYQTLADKPEDAGKPTATAIWQTSFIDGELAEAKQLRAVNDLTKYLADSRRILRPMIGYGSLTTASRETVVFSASLDDPSRLAEGLRISRVPLVLPTTFSEVGRVKVSYGVPSVAAGALPAGATSPYGPDSELRLLDIDGDANNDIVVLVTVPPLAGTASPLDATSQLFVLFGHGDGTFDAPIDITPTAPGQRKLDTSPSGFVLLQITPTKRALIVASHRGAWITEAASARTFAYSNFLAAPNVAGDTTEIASWLTQGSDVISGDFDGDGIDDVAIANSGTFRVFKQLAVGAR